MINIKQLSEERPLNLSAAANYIERLTGEKPHVSTIWRWCLKGCKGTRLESICVGGKRYVTVSAIERFISARSQPNTPPATKAVTITKGVSPHVERHNARRREEIAAARHRLDELTRGGVRRSNAGDSLSR